MTDFDVIIIGAGSAGAVLAARLSEDADRRVLLVDAGPDHRSADTPAGISGPNFWEACATPGRVFADLVAVHRSGQDPAPYLRGRGVGGSSAVNAMVAMRALPEDLDHWAEDLGCAGWSAKDMHPWLLGVEDDLDVGADDHHGGGGPLPLSRPDTARWSPVERGLQTATADLGYSWCDDYHAPGAGGFGPAALTVRHGRRVSTNDAYLEPARDRTNLTVRGDTLVDRVTFDGERVTGVRTVTGEEITAPEVVVSAGTIHSPAILLRSGVTERPVGENLTEHPLLPIVLVLNAGSRAELAGVRTISSLLRYSSDRAGAGRHDMQILPLTPFGTEPPLSALAVLGVAATQVFSRGRVSLAASGGTTEPAVHFDMLSDDRDRERMRDGFRRLTDLARHQAVAGLTDVVLAGETPLDDLDDDGALDAWMDQTVTNYVHSVGTCRMGDPDDAAAVVDLSCRVIGRRGLSVVDASVLPDIPRANTHLTVVAVAERVAADRRSL